MAEREIPASPRALGRVRWRFPVAVVCSALSWSFFLPARRNLRPATTKLLTDVDHYFTLSKLCVACLITAPPIVMDRSAAETASAECSITMTEQRNIPMD